MARYRKQCLPEPVLPPFDLARQWKNPAVLLVFSIFLMLVSGLTLKEWLVESPTVASLFVVDVSESARQNDEHGHWLMHLCDRHSSYLQPGDRHLNIWFADEARTIGALQILESKSIAPPQQNCELPPSAEDLNTHHLGQQPGTSLTQAVQHAHHEVQKIRSRDPNMPVIVAFVLHEFEPGPTESGNFKHLKQAIETLSNEAQIQIRLIGPQGNLATQVSQQFFQIEGAQFCFLRSLKHMEHDIDACFRDAFTTARAATR